MSNTPPKIPPKKRAKKEEAQLLAAVDASTQVPVIGADTSIIDEQSPKNKGTNKKNTKNLGGLTMESSVPDLSIKVYEEQIDGGFPALFERIRALDKAEYWAIAIVHDKDKVADEIFEPAFLKPHAHIDALRSKRNKDNRVDRRKVSTFLNLLGITFRPGLDDELWKQRGVERIKDLGHSVAYLTHETKDAENAGKHVYERDEIVSNLDPAEINELRAGYKRISAVAQRADLATQAELAELCYQAGLTGEKSWKEIEKELPVVLQKGSAYVWLRRKYAEGMAERFEKNRSLVRLSIFIQGPQNVGKTTGARKAIEAMGLSCYVVSDGGKTGKWDRLTPSHDALLIDDAILNDVLGMADNRVCEVYRRGSDNPYFCGRLLVVCSNMSFDDWLRACNIQDRQKEAARSRFYLCRVVEKNGEPALVLDSFSKRGAPEERRARAEMFDKFARPMEESMRAYRAMEKDEVDYSILDKFMETEPRQISLWDKPKARDYKRPVWRDPTAGNLFYSWGDGMTHNRSYEEGYLKSGTFHSERVVKYIKDEDEEKPLPF